MRVWDAQNAIRERLQALSWQRYMSAMWILGSELATLYADQLSESEKSLASATLAIVRDVAASGDSAGLAQPAAELAAQWGRVIAQGEQRASGGLLNAWMTFEGAAAEVSGASAHFYAADWVVGAAIRRWRDPDRRGPRRVDPNEQVADDSPTARTLATFDHVVTAVTDAPDWDLDPAMVRRIILGH